MKKTAILLAAILSLSLAGCSGADADSSSTAPSRISTLTSSSTPETSSSSEPSSSEADEKHTIPEITAAGKVDGVTYTNDILGVTYTMPEGWLVDDPEATLQGQLDRLAATQGQSVADSNKKNVEAGYTGFLFYASTESETETSNILIQIADESNMNGATPVEYAAVLAEAFEQGYTQFGLQADVDEAEEITIDGHKIAVASVQVVLDGEINGYTFDNYHVAQAYSIYTVNDTAVIAMLSAFSDEDLEAGLNTLKNVKFAS